MKPTQEHRDKLKNLSSILAKSHKAMIDHLFVEREKVEGHVIATGGRLQLLLGDPDFAWLRNLSQLMTMVDDFYFQKEPITEEQMVTAKNETTELLISGNKPEFAGPYQQLVDLLPAVAYEHGRLLEALKNFHIMQ